MTSEHKLTDAELEIMKVVWKLGGGTVREVYEVLRERKQTAYTTVMTMLNILERKGHLAKDKRDRAFVYRPVESKSQVISSMVNDFLQRVFNGSARPLLLNMVKEKKISREDLLEIEKLMEDVE